MINGFILRRIDAVAVQHSAASVYTRKKDRINGAPNGGDIHD
jgi:hypothetical protein